MCNMNASRLSPHSVSLSSSSSSSSSLLSSSSPSSSSLLKMYWDAGLVAYEDFMARGDERILTYPLMQSPLPTISLCMAYLLFIRVIGPNVMRHRKAYELRIPMIAYNFSMVLLNGYLFWFFGVYGWFGKYNFKCQPVDRSNHPDAMGMVRIGWIFYASKFIEFLDTIFFVLRKKDSQISTLHVIHHMTMPFNVWFTIRFAPGGHSSFCSFVNSFVHVVMYSYYALAAIGPQLQPFLWWKRYITKLQLTQFVLVMAHCFQLLFRECDYPRIFMVYIGFYAILFLFMFSDFYSKAYVSGLSSSSPSSSLLSSSSYPSSSETSSASSSPFCWFLQPPATGEALLTTAIGGNRSRPGLQ